MTSLLPPSSTKFERALEAAATRGEIGSNRISDIWNPTTCPVDLLPWLAWAVGVEDWNPNWSEANKRAVIAATPDIRRHRGTVWAVKEALKSAGYADAQIEEGLPMLRRDGSALYNGVDYHSAGSRWAIFSIIADVGEGQPITTEERNLLLSLIERAKPLRSQLREIIYKATADDAFDLQDQHGIKVGYEIEDLRPAGLRHNGQILRNQATRLDKKPTTHNGAFFYNGSNDHNGLEPNYSWQIHGATYNNEWDSYALKLNTTQSDIQAVAATRDASAARDSSLTRGQANKYATDLMQFKQTIRVRRYGRTLRNGTHHHKPTTVLALTA